MQCLDNLHLIPIMWFSFPTEFQSCDESCCCTSFSYCFVVDFENIFARFRINWVKLEEGTLGFTNKHRRFRVWHEDYTMRVDNIFMMTTIMV